MTVDRMKKRSISCVNFECLLLVVIVSIVLLNNLPNMRLKGTITEQNLLKAFAGESQARNRYTFFAQTAKEEGYEQIAGVFAETADQELAHARRFFDFLDGGGMITIEAEYPAGRIGKTKENLYELRRSIGMVFQQPNPFHKSIRENITFGYFRTRESQLSAEKSA